MTTAGPGTSAVTAVLDASAVLAWLRAETGADRVDGHLTSGAMSAVNWSETWQKLDQHGVDADRATGRLRVLGLRVDPLDATDAVTAARLWQATRSAGLSLGDRCCLALATRLAVPAITADTAWAGLNLPVTVEIIR